MWLVAMWLASHVCGWLCAWLECLAGRWLIKQLGAYMANCQVAGWLGVWLPRSVACWLRVWLCGWAGVLYRG